MEPTHRVRIEFKRIQTFLFAVPRLRHMVGANVLVRETTRNDVGPPAIKEGGDLSCCA